jgi:pimeloyl-ACP methyl ester carboxylesterase
LAGIGQVWAVQYDNAGLDTAVISELVTQHSRRAGVRHIVVAGHSMGGIIALEVAKHLYEDGDLDVQAVLLDCTPINLHAVRAQSRDAGEDMLRWMGWVPGARESRALRLLVETASRKDRYLLRASSGHPLVDTGELTDVVKEVLRKKLLSDDAASNGLIESQFKAIVASGAQNDLQTLTDESGGRTPPAIIFMRPAFGDDDRVVDVDYSQQVLLDDLAKSNAPFLVVRMAGTGHANPKQQPGIYNAAIDTKVVPFLDRMEERADNAVITQSTTDVAGAVSSP